MDVVPYPEDEQIGSGQQHGAGHAEVAGPYQMADDRRVRQQEQWFGHQGKERRDSKERISRL